jgi:hypothetical protein
MKNNNKNCEDILKEGDIIEIKEGDELPIPPKPLTYETKTDINGKKYDVLTYESLEEMARQARLHAYHLCVEEESKKEEPEHE